ncbi:MAG: LysR substrate-binding domain-containing protein [Bacteroidales bacterium]|nr:LysR substrate-binding domain-containing protein [Bacteroidales bacterium]
MELRQLQYFLKAAELQNFTEASRQLFITQSTLSQQIKQLENELGMLLFDRIGKRVFLTEAGKEFAPFARQTISDANLGKQRILDLQNVRTGSLRVAVTYSLSFILPSIVLRFMEEYPNVKLEIIYSTSSEMLQMLKHRQVDFVLSFKSDGDDEIDETDLFEIPLTVVVNKSHPLAKEKSVSLQSLRQFSLVLPSEGLTARAILDKLMEENSVLIEPHLEMNDANILLQLVESSMYATILSKATTIGRTNLKTIPITEQRENMMASLLTLKGAYIKAAAQRFISLVKENMASMVID